jgi:uncharacterized Zn-binding protein involved in type VI secretion
MPPAARVTDIHICSNPAPKPHGGGPINPSGSPLVISNGLAQARATDPCTCTPPAPLDFIVTGAGQVLVDGLPAARMTDKTMHPPPGMIAVGSPNILIGGPTVGVTLGGGTAATQACQDAASGRPSGSTQQTWNNCGTESCRQIINQAKGTNLTEANVLDRAIARDQAEETPDPHKTGGTSASDRQAILADHGIASQLQDASMDNITQAVAEKKGVISGHTAATFFNNQQRGTHAVLVTGMQYDANGNLVNVIVNDTGLGVCGRAVPLAQYQNSLVPGKPINVTDNPIF